MNFMEFVKSILNQIAPIDEDSWNLFKVYLVNKALKKGERFTTIGDEVTHFAFIKRGILKISYLPDANGKEIIKLFSGPGDLIGAYADYLRATPSRVNITAMSDCEICSFAFKDIDKLMNGMPQWELYRRKIGEYHYLLKEDKEYELLVNTAEERYDKFQIKFSSFENLIPDYMVAAYLNVTPSYLSTLKNRKRV